ncbi:MAG: Ig-like domain-containing protein [bacterium]|nr:Ig-like domain-containing protein [bacterium]
MSGQQRENKGKKAVNRNVKAVFCLVFFVLFLLFVLRPVAAQQSDIAGLQNFENSGSGLATTDFRVLIGNIIRIFLGLLGTIAIVLILYAGFMWMTAAGNEEKIEKAKKILTNAVIGLAIILSAYAITSFIISSLLSASSGGTITDDGGGRDVNTGSGSLGGGIVKDHYPPRDAHCTGTPPSTAGCISRDTKIIVTFKEPMRVATIINDKGTTVVDNDTDADKLQKISDDVIIPETIKLQKSINLVGKTASEREATWDNLQNLVTNMKAAATPDGKIFVFAPQAFLGSPSEPISYTMRLDEGIKKANGDAAFGRLGKPYEWQFEVSTIIDSTPPTITSVIPLPPQTNEDKYKYARNVVVQVNFSEAVDPTTVAGIVSGVVAENKSKIIVIRQNPPPNKSSTVKGEVAIANQYQTIEFVTDLECGENSCGGKVYCLPENDTITVHVPSASLTDDNPDDAPFTAAMYNGVVDLAGNSLDGNGNGTADGKGQEFNYADYTGGPYKSINTSDKDDFMWVFNTNDTIDLTPPKIEALTPEPGKGNILLDQSLRVTFSKPLLFSTFQAPNVLLEPAINYSTEKEDIKNADGKIIKTIGIIKHDQFVKNTAYTPTITAGVKDGFQNCYFPCAGLTCNPTKQAPSCKLP